jgi:MoaA/NifB/PqqE/SkfB family radical SAM enzyme
MKKADIKLGYECNNDCVHCVIADFKDALLSKGSSENLTTEQYVKEMEESRRNGADNIVFTGGEPTIRHDLIHLLRKAREMGYKVHIQSNGRRFNDRTFSEKVAACGIESYCIALHAHIAEVHDSITRRKGSFEETAEGMRNLLDLDQNLIGKFVISKYNLAYLTETAKLFVELGMRHVSITFPHGCGNARKYFLEVVPRYSELVPSLYHALQFLEERAIRIETEALPFCFMPGFERYVQDLTYINEGLTELKQLGIDKPIDWHIERKNIKKKFEVCRKCRYDSICEGPWNEYPEYYGDLEFKAVPGQEICRPQALRDGSWFNLYRADRPSLFYSTLTR